METIFDHNVTPKEIKHLDFLGEWACIRHGIDFDMPITPQSYKKQISKEGAIFDIAILLEHRGIDASKYWEMIPELAQEYRLGKDYFIDPE